MDCMVTILGTRGSYPVSGSQYSKYGWATTCVVVRMDQQLVALDAGTGLAQLKAPENGTGTLPLILSHPHADHLLGLPLAPWAMCPGARVELYGKDRDGLSVAEQVRTLVGPPLWPITVAQLPAEFSFHPLRDSFELGPVHVDVLEGVHPGGVSLLRLSGGGKRIVFATDCTLTDTLRPALLEFARDCDLLLMDGQFSDAEWAGRSGFGHSRWSDVARFGRDCNASMVRVIHHDPGHSDAFLDAASAELAEVHPNCSFAREGEELNLP